MLNSESHKSSAQISILRSGEDKRLYCCESVRSEDAAGNPHVLCAGVDLSPALVSQNIDPREIIDAIEASCNENGGAGPIPSQARKQFEGVGKILNIGWIADGAAKDAIMICQRSSNCPRRKHCLGETPPLLKSQIDNIRASVIGGQA